MTSEHLTKFIPLCFLVATNDVGSKDMSMVPLFSGYHTIDTKMLHKTWNKHNLRPANVIGGNAHVRDEGMPNMYERWHFNGSNEFAEGKMNWIHLWFTLIHVNGKSIRGKKSIEIGGGSWENGLCVRYMTTVRDESIRSYTPWNVWVYLCCEIGVGQFRFLIDFQPLLNSTTR